MTWHAGRVCGCDDGRKRGSRKTSGHLRTSTGVNPERPRPPLLDAPRSFRRGARRPDTVSALGSNLGCEGEGGRERKNADRKKKQLGDRPCDVSGPAEQTVRLNLAENVKTLGGDNECSPAGQPHLGGAPQLCRSDQKIRCRYTRSGSLLVSVGKCKPRLAR